MKARFEKNDVLSHLDSCVFYSYLPNLGHGYFPFSGARINLFADSKRWAIVFEKTSYSNVDHDVKIELIYFGNCLINLQYSDNEKKFPLNLKWITLIDQAYLYEKFPDKVEDTDVRTLQVRDRELEIEYDIEKYLNRRIYPNRFDEADTVITTVSMIRYLDELNPELFRASFDELYSSIPLDLPKIMVIDDWYQEEDFVFQGPDRKKPSESELFQLLAEVLASKDPSKWKPTHAPNSNWRNWPMAGGL